MPNLTVQISELLVLAIIPLAATAVVLMLLVTIRAMRS